MPRARGAACKCTSARDSAVGRMLAHARARPFACALARARARTRAPSFLPSSAYRPPPQLPVHFPATASSFPPYPTPPRAARSRPRASLLHCAGLQGSEPSSSPPPSPTCYARAIPRHLMPSGFSPLTMSGKALVSMRLVCQTDGASLTLRRARRRKRYGWTRKAALRTTALPTYNQSMVRRCVSCSVERSRGCAFTSLELPLLPPRPDLYARQHSLTQQADCLCVRCAARPCLCVCVGRKRRCSQALSTCSPFLPRSVPLARSCPRAPRLRSINPSSPLPPPDRLYAHPLSFFECASGPRLRSCFPGLLSSSAFPTSSLRASRPHDACLLYSLSFIGFSSGALLRHASCSTHSPKCQWYSLPWGFEPMTSRLLSGCSAN